MQNGRNALAAAGRQWFGRTALSQGTTLAREAARLGVELTRIAWGRSDVAPAKGDRHFTDPAWTSNPAFRMIQQSYLASTEAIDRIVAAMPIGAAAPWRSKHSSRPTSWPSAAAPTNFLMSNPAALKRAFDTGGMSLARGARNFVHDVRRNGAMPSMIEPGAFEMVATWPLPAAPSSPGTRSPRSCNTYRPRTRYSSTRS